MTDQLRRQEIRATANSLHSIAIHLLRGLQDVDARSGLSRARLSALSVIVFAGPLRVSRLAEIEGVKPPTMTLLVRALEAEDLVRRAPDPSDARASLVSATDAGEQILAQTRALRLAAIEEKLGALSRHEQSAVERAVAILVAVYVPQGPPPLGDLPPGSVADAVKGTSPGKPEGIGEKLKKRGTD